ncbi:hypothetical protein [Candidatus Palauibacter sp.]
MTEAGGGASPRLAVEASRWEGHGGKPGSWARVVTPGAGQIGAPG